MMFPLAGVFARLGATGLQGDTQFSLAGGVECVERLEVIAGPLGRRSWSDEAKARIVLESHAPGPCVVDVARRGLRLRLGRGAEHPRRILDGFTGVLQVDGYAACKTVSRALGPDAPLRLAHCWAHGRRRLADR
jgi:hypothetical protein